MQNHDKRERELIVGSPMPKVRYWLNVAIHAMRRYVQRRITSLRRSI